MQRNESNQDGNLYNKFSILERGFVMRIDADVVIVGTGVAGLFSALNLPRDKKIVMITKADLESSDSFLAQEEFVYSMIRMTMTVTLKIQ